MQWSAPMTIFGINPTSSSKSISMQRKMQKDTSSGLWLHLDCGRHWQRKSHFAHPYVSYRDVHQLQSRSYEAFNFEPNEMEPILCNFRSIFPCCHM